MRNFAYLLGIFTANLADGDSYMYLSAINGLVALGHVFTDRVLPVLAAEFACVILTCLPACLFACMLCIGCMLLILACRETRHDIETRLKVGEAMVKVCRACGQVRLNAMQACWQAVNRCHRCCRSIYIWYCQSSFW